MRKIAQLIVVSVLSCYACATAATIEERCKPHPARTGVSGQCNVPMINNDCVIYGYAAVPDDQCAKRTADARVPTAAPMREASGMFVVVAPADERVARHALRPNRSLPRPPCSGIAIEPTADKQCFVVYRDETCEIRDRMQISCDK